MKIVGLMVCGPGEADRYLKASLDEFKLLCDDAVIVGNNTDLKTEELIKSYGYWFYRDDREWGLYQPNIKEDLLKKIAGLKPDWIIPLDSDEVFAKEFTREEAERLASTKEIAWHFTIVNLYDDTEHFAHDKGIQRFWNIRFFKFLPEHLKFQNKRVHCGLAPPIYYKYGWYAPYFVEHYGLMKKEDRQKKVERYKKYDPQAKFKGREYYDDLENKVNVYPFNREKLLKQLADSIDCKPRNTPKI